MIDFALRRIAWRFAWKQLMWWNRFLFNTKVTLASKAPNELRYWLTLDAIAKASVDEYGTTVVPELRAMTVLQRIAPKNQQRPFWSVR